MTHPDTQSANPVQAGTSKDDLIAQTRNMIVAYDATETAQRNAERQIADNLATLRDRDRMSQRDIAAAMKKSVGWVNGILAWRDGGFIEDTPFGGAERRDRDRSAYAERRAAKPAPIKTGKERSKSPDGFSEDAKRNIAAAPAGNDDDPQKTADERKAVNAEFDKPAPKPASPGSGDTKQLKKGSSEWLFNEAVYFDAHTMASMDDSTFGRVMAMFSAKRAERRPLKAVA